MPDEHSIPLKNGVAALGQSLAEMRARAEEAAFRLVLICTLLGYRMVRPAEDGRSVPRAAVPRESCPLPGMRGVFLPAFAGTAGRARALQPE